MVYCYKGSELLLVQATDENLTAGGQDRAMDPGPCGQSTATRVTVGSDVVQAGASGFDYCE